MRAWVSFILFPLVLTSFLSHATLAQSHLKTWSESSASDFGDGQLTNLVVDTSAGGEVFLTPALHKTLQEIPNDTSFRFTARNQAGTIARSWVEQGNVFLRMYNPDGTPRSGSIRVNPIDGQANDAHSPSSALFNDGTCIVVWYDDYRQGDNDLTMYGQIFRNDSVKVGTAFQINPDGYNSSASWPVALANETDGLFWIFFPFPTANGHRLHVHKRDKQAQKVGETFLLNSQPATVNEFQVAAVADAGGFDVAWAGSNTNVSTDEDLFLRKFDGSGNPLSPITKANDDQVPHAQTQPALSVEDRGNILAAWIDERETKGPTSVDYRFYVYGQAFNASLGRLGPNIRLDQSPYYENRDPGLSSVGSEFELTWLAFDRDAFVYRQYRNRWKCEPVFSGTLVSSLFDAGPAGARLQIIGWHAAVPAGSSLRFRLRTAGSVEELARVPWYGPHDTAGFYTAGEGETVNPAHNAGRFVQYAALFDAPDGVSPILDSVAVTFVPADTVPPSAPTALKAAGGHGFVALTWNPPPEPDVAGYTVYRGTSPGSYDPAWRRASGRAETGFKDSTAQAGTAYYYVVTASDSGHNESAPSGEVSCTFRGINLYVSAAAPPGGDGSPAQPFSTVAGAQAAAFYGDTVRVLPGEYGENVTMRKGISLVGTDPLQSKIAAAIEAADNCLIGGLTITGGIRCTGTSPQIIGNIISMPLGYIPAIQVTGEANAMIAKNFITGSRINVDWVALATIRNNILCQPGDVGIQSLGSFYGIPRIVNNTIVGATLNGLMAQKGIILNNVIVGAGGQSSAIQIPAPAPYDTIRVVKFNTIWNTRETAPPFPENLLADPLFVSPATQDFHLLPGSPCKDAGDPGDSYRDVDGSRNDIGAYGGPDPFPETFGIQLIRSLSVSRASASPGDTVSITLSVDNPAGLSEAVVVLAHDNNLLKYLKSQTTATTEGSLVTVTPAGPGELHIAISSASGWGVGAGELCRLFFVVNPQAGTSDGSPLTVRSAVLIDANRREAILRSVTDGAVAVTRFTQSEHSIFVNAAAGETQDGSARHPFKTISQAMRKAGAGDSVLVAAGTYMETLSMKEGVHLIGSGAAVTSLVLDDPLLVTQLVTFIDVVGSELSGFTLCSKEGTPGLGSLLYCVNSTPLATRNRIIGKAGAMPAIGLYGCPGGLLEKNYLQKGEVHISGGKPVFRNNVVEGDLGSPAGTITCGQGAAPVIAGNTLVNGASISVSGTTGGDSSLIIRNNSIVLPPGSLGEGIGLNGAAGVRICNNVIRISAVPSTGIRVMSSVGTEITNNTIVTRHTGISEDNSTSRVLNNVIVGNLDVGAELSSSSTANYNDFWANAASYRGLLPGANDIFSNPRFVDSARSDFRLATGSPCINAGSPEPAFLDPDGSRNDIGAYGGPYADTAWLYQNGSTLAVDSATVIASDTLLLRVVGQGMMGVAALSLDLAYDPQVLRVVEAAPGALTRLFSIEKSLSSAGHVGLRMTAPRGMTEEIGELANIRAVVLAKGTTSTTVRFDSASAVNEEVSQRQIRELKSGTISILSTGIGDFPGQDLPTSFQLFQNYPNPFNPSTTIRYGLPARSAVTLAVYNVLGQRVKELVHGVEEAGYHTARFDGRGLASGMYFYRLQAGSFVQVKALLLLK